MAAVFSSTTKLMLKNVIRHTNSHNKTVEEADMWQQYERIRETGGLKPSNPSYGHDDRCEPRGKIQDYSWSSRSKKGKNTANSYYSKRAHMDSEEEEKQGGSLSTSSTYWTRQLQKMESSDPNRWDHSGFKELYPEDFRSDRSDGSSSESSAHHHSKKKKSSTRKKKKHHKKRKHKKKEKSSHKHRKQSRKRLGSDSGDSDLDPHPSVSDTSDCSLKKSKKWHVDRKGSRKGSSNCSNFSESDSDSESCDRKRFSKKVTVKRTRQCSASSDSVSLSDKRKVKHYTENQRKKLKKHKKRSRRYANSKTVSKQEKDGLVDDVWKEVSGHSLKRKYAEDRKREGRERHKDTEVRDTHSHRKRRKYSYSPSSSSDRD